MTRARIGVALLIVALVVYWLTRGHDRAAPSPAPPPVVAHELPPPPVLAPGPGPATALDEPADPIQAAPAAPPPSPYPPGSQPLTEGSDPATAAPEDNPIDAERGMRVVFGPRKDVVHPPDPIVIDLQVVDAAGKRLAIRDGRAYFRGERATAAVGTGPRAPFVDEGGLHYAARFAPTGPDQSALLQFRVFVEVAFDMPGLGERRASTWVQYTPEPHARLTRTFAEHVIDGSLVLDAGVAVTQRGHYKVIASLYAADRTTAIAFAQNAAELEPGVQAIPLTFFGKILRDRGLDGPYVVRYAMLFEEFPDRGTYWPGVTVDNAYTTSAYHASDFSDAPYVAPVRAEPEVTADSPSQQGKPPPLFTR